MINNRTKNKDYQFIRTYSSLLDAQKGVQNREIGEQLWTRGVKYETQEGSKICYTCRGHPKCNKRMLMVLDPASQDVHVSISSDAHSHINNFFSKGLNALTKAKVIELLDSGVTKPAKIIKNIENLNLPHISRLQIANLKARINKNVRGPLTCDLNQFLTLVRKREAVPDDDDQVYVAAYELKLSKSQTKIKDLRCFLTTRRLIKNALKSKKKQKNFFDIVLN